MVTTQPALAVSLDAHAQHLRVAVGNEMRSLQSAFALQSRFALEQQRLMMLQPLGAHKEIGERGMSLVGLRIGERHFKGGYQFDIKGAIPKISELDLAELDIVLRTDPHRRVRLNLRPYGVEAGALGMIDCRVMRIRITRRMLGD